MSGPANETTRCIWYQDGDYDSDTYASSCKNYFSLNQGTPEENGFKFCVWCGRPLQQKLIEIDQPEEVSEK